MLVCGYRNSFACIFDRYQSLHAAKEFEEISRVSIIKNDPRSFIIDDAKKFNICRSTDIYNHYLFSEIIQITNMFDFEFSKDDISIKHLVSRKTISRSLKNNILTRLNRCIPSFLNRIVFISSYLNPIDLIKLQLSMKQLPYIFTPQVETPTSNYDGEIREKINLKLEQNSFESLISTTLKQHIPSVYVEGFKEMMNKSLKLYPKNPSVIFTAGAYGTDEGFKFWAASNVEKGSKLVGTQHGFNYGAIKWFHEEDHQIKCYDKFYTWDWESDRFNNTSYLPAAKFNHKVKNITPDSNGQILFATYAWPRYSYKMMTTPISASQSYKFIDSQIEILKHLSSEAKIITLVRSKNVPIFEGGINQRKMWENFCPDVKFYMGNDVSMYEQMKKSRLFVSIVCGTAQLESFSANFPTLLYWSPFHEIRKSAKPVFEALIDAGILYKTAEGLAHKINDIHDDPISWWLQPKVQEAKNSFCNEFARTSNNWLKTWKKELIGVKNGI